jgi:uncharacterized protein (TIGR02145 family)
MKFKNIIKILLVILLTSSIISCKKDLFGPLPTVVTYSPQYVASTEATVGCTVKSNETSQFICGLYFSTVTSPELTGFQFQIGADTGLFLGQVTGLAPNTQYFVRAYVKNAKEESLGEEINFTTPGTISDYDNNVYGTVKIGGQQWMTENLQTTHYLNGDLIATTALVSTDISGETSPKYQWSYEGVQTNTAIYGKLYTYYAVTDSRNVCPAGWHVPGDTEWSALETALGGYSIAGSKLKEPGNSHWLSPYNLDATNETCFHALPGGYRNITGFYSYLGNYGYWWSSTQADVNSAWVRTIFVQTAPISRTDFIKKNGASVRCIKDL